MPEYRTKISRWVFKFLQIICPDELFEEIEGDLIQKFNRDTNAFGSVSAHRKLFLNAALFFRPGIILRNKFSLQLNQFPMIRNYFVSTYRHAGKEQPTDLRNQQVR